ncbi:MAG: signal peptidase I [Candidatus Sabulitectum sp.]|nr:signal peptidase I [Candidatus Sabulitectum sp.]
MKKVSGFLVLLVLMVFSGIAVAGDPFIEDIMGNGVLITVSILFNLAVMAFLVMAQWKLFVKAGEEGWIALIPIYNAVVMMKIAGKPGWWVLLLFVPFANIVVAILMNIGLARNFGRSDGFAIGLIFFPYIFLAVLGFGESKYSPIAVAI